MPGAVNLPSAAEWRTSQRSFPCAHEVAHGCEVDTDCLPVRFELCAVPPRSCVPAPPWVSVGYEEHMLCSASQECVLT